MGRGGARPGAGRPRNQPDRSTREIKAAVAERIVKAGEQSFLETMLYKRNYYMRIVARELNKGDAADLKALERALDKACDVAIAGAKYMHPTMASVTVQQQPFDLSKLSDEQLVELERIARAAALPAGDTSGTSQTQH